MAVFTHLALERERGARGSASLFRQAVAVPPNEAARSRSYSCLAIGAALELPSSLTGRRKVSRADQAAAAAIAVMAKAMAPTVNGTLVDPGGATVAKSAGSRAVMVVPTFCEIAIAETR